MLISANGGGYMISNCGESLSSSKVSINDLMILTLVALIVTILYTFIKDSHLGNICILYSSILFHYVWTIR